MSLLLFPIAFFPSPYVRVAGAAEEVVNGSLLVFGAMIVAALLVGRLWCGWLSRRGAQ